MCQLKDHLVSPIMALVFWHFLVATNFILYPHENCLSSLCCSMFPMQTMQSKHIIFIYDFADFLRSRALSNCVQRLLCFLSWKDSHTWALFCHIWLFATCVYWWGVIGGPFWSRRIKCLLIQWVSTYGNTIRWIALRYESARWRARL